MAVRLIRPHFFTLSILGLFVNSFCVRLMNFPNSLAQRWREKRFNSFNRVLRDRFDARVYKVGLRMDFTCPNRDGKVAVGGCIYCNNASHTAQDYRPRTSVTTQLEKGALAIHRRHTALRGGVALSRHRRTVDRDAAGLPCR